MAYIPPNNLREYVGLAGQQQITSIFNEDIVQDQFEAWRQQSVTKALIRNIETLREATVVMIAGYSNNSAIDSETIRRYASSLKNTDAILSMMKNFQVFKQQLTKQ